MKFWDHTLEYKSVVISSLATIVAFLATLFLFWYGRYEIPLAFLTSGLVVVITWLIVLLYYKKHTKPKVKVDVFCIYLRLVLIVAISIIFAVIQIITKTPIVSPIFIVIGYFFVSLCSLVALIERKQ